MTVTRDFGDDEGVVTGLSFDPIIVDAPMKEKERKKLDIFNRQKFCEFGGKILALNYYDAVRFTAEFHRFINRGNEIYPRVISPISCEILGKTCERFLKFFNTKDTRVLTFEEVNQKLLMEKDAPHDIDPNKIWDVLADISIITKWLWFTVYRDAKDDDIIEGATNIIIDVCDEKYEEMSRELESGMRQWKYAKFTVVSDEVEKRIDKLEAIESKKNDA